MAVVMGTVTQREFDVISARGWRPWVMTAVEFRRFFRHDPGYIAPGQRIAVVALTHCVMDVMNALSNRNDDEPQLHIAGRIADGETPGEPGKGA